MRPTFRTLKIEDERALQALAVEHVESLEEGLRILGVRVLLGESTVDLVAQDRDGRLVLAALSLVGDDAMILRMLEAFAWCREYPSIIGRLYALPAAVLAAPPRVMFVAGRLSDAFLRKVKHLRMPAIDCLEFRYLEVNGVAGLYFNPVETPHSLPAAPATRAAVAAPPAVVASLRVEPAAVEPATVPSVIVDDPPPPEPIELLTAVEEPAVEAAAATEPLAAGPEVAEPVGVPVSSAAPAPASSPRRAGEVRSSDLLQGLRLPDNFSSQWQRILNRAVEAPDPAKIRAVREYLQSEFPGCVLYDFYEHKGSAQMFHLQNSQGEVMHVAAVSDGFLDGQAERDIRPFLERNRVASALREAGTRHVVITAAGAQVPKG